LAHISSFYYATVLLKDGYSIATVSINIQSPVYTNRHGQKVTDMRSRQKNKTKQKNLPREEEMDWSSRWNRKTSLGCLRFSPLNRERQGKCR
jgi:hypothetical protein